MTEDELDQVDQWALEARALDEALSADNPQARAQARLSAVTQFVRAIDAGQQPDGGLLRVIAEMLRALPSIDFAANRAHNNPVSQALGLSGDWAKETARRGRKRTLAAQVTFADSRRQAARAYAESSHVEEDSARRSVRRVKPKP